LEEENASLSKNDPVKWRQREAWERPSRSFSRDRRNCRTLASRTSILATMVLGSHNVDKIVGSKMDVVRVRAKSICEFVDLYNS